MFSFLLISIFLFKKDKRIPKRLNREEKGEKGGRLLIGPNPDRHKNVTFLFLRKDFQLRFPFLPSLSLYLFPLLSPLLPNPLNPSSLLLLLHVCLTLLSPFFFLGTPS
jgi:hypothetical protein